MLHTCFTPRLAIIFFYAACTVILVVLPVLLTTVVRVTFSIVVYNKVVTVETASDNLLVAFLVNRVVETLIFFDFV